MKRLAAIVRPMPSTAPPIPRAGALNPRASTRVHRWLPAGRVPPLRCGWPGAVLPSPPNREEPCRIGRRPGADMVFDEGIVNRDAAWETPTTKAGSNNSSRGVDARCPSVGARPRITRRSGPAQMASAWPLITSSFRVRSASLPAPSFPSCRDATGGDTERAGPPSPPSAAWTASVLCCTHCPVPPVWPTRRPQAGAVSESCVEIPWAPRTRHGGQEGRFRLARFRIG